MAKNIADACQIDAEQVNVKATTEEQLGFTGSGEGKMCIRDRSSCIRCICRSASNQAV